MSEPEEQRRNKSKSLNRKVATEALRSGSDITVNVKREKSRTGRWLSVIGRE